MTHAEQHAVAIIMAGGSGERFWPLSRAHTPKQLLALTGTGQSLLGVAIERARRIFARENIFIATTQSLGGCILKAGLNVAAENVLAEPHRKNTAGALVYVAATLRARLPEGSDPALAILTADHEIGAPEMFANTVRACLAEAQHSDALTTIGIVPTRPETGYGYLEIAEDAAPVAIREGLPVMPVARFHEKPDLATAREFVASRRFLWNSGMFFWRLSVFERALKSAHPILGAAIDTLAEAMRRGDTAVVDAAFAALPSQSIDHALMERAPLVRLVRGEFPWDDMGAWDAFARHASADTAGNVAVGDPLLIDTRDCLVYNDAGGKMAVVALGLEGLAVVVCPDAVLIVPRERAQEVREAVRRLRERGSPQAE